MLNDSKKQMLSSTICMGILIFLAFFAAYAGQTFSQPPAPRPLKIEQPPQAKTAIASDSANANQRGTENSPLIVKVLPTPKTAEEAANDKQDRDEKTASDWWIIKLTGALALIGALQLLVFGYQALKLRQTVHSMNAQSEDIKRYTAEAARSANAMEDVSASLRINADRITETVEMNRMIASRQNDFWTRQMRAYVSVLIGSGIYQETFKGLRFEVKPAVRNSGGTPAYDVRHRSRAAILPINLPQNFRFTLPKEWAGGGAVGPHSHVEISAIVPDLISDDEVTNVKTGNGKILYAWGTVSYKDLFKRTRRITFAQQIIWVGEPGKESIKGFYLNRHNKSN